MTTVEVKEKIKEEYISRYYTWLADRYDLTDREYGEKYGWLKSERLLSLKDNQKALIFFQQYIFTGMWLQKWERAGYDPETLWELRDEGFLSHKHYWGREARASGNYDWLFISQATAKQIYKEKKLTKK